MPTDLAEQPGSLGVIPVRSVLMFRPRPVATRGGWNRACGWGRVGRIPPTCTART